MNSITLRFATVNSIFYLIYGIIYGYAAFYLRAKGFSSTETGIVFAVSSAACIVLQTLIGNFLDSHLKYSAKHIIAIFSIILTIAVVILFFIHQRYVILLCFLIIMTILLVDSSLFNAFAMEYINAGEPLDFSLCRGLGSLAYSVVTLLMGILISKTSEDIIIPSFFIVQALVFLSLTLLKPAARYGTATSGDPSVTEVRTSAELLRSEPLILLLFTGILMMYLSYTAINNFHVNIIEAAGGGSRELGISTSIAAFLELPVMAAFIQLSRRFSYSSLLKFSCFFFVVKVLLMSFASSLISIYAIQSLQLLSYGLFVPASTYYINSVLSKADMAKGQTLLGIFTFGLSGLISSLLSGIMLDHYSVLDLMRVLTLLAVTGFLMICISLKRLKPQ